MSAKVLLPDQHTLLHGYYAPQDCCLCHSEEEIGRLQNRITELEEFIEVSEQLSFAKGQYSGT